MYNLMFKKLINVILFIAGGFTALNSSAGPVSEFGQLRVEGNKIVSTNTQQPVQLKGYSTHGLQWFPLVTGQGGTVENMVNDFGVQVIRLAMYVREWDQGKNTHVGYLGIHPDIYQTQVRPLILDAIANDIYVIVDWHIHWNPPTPQNLHWTPDPYTTEASAFFKMVAQEFGNYPNIIYEVMNEPGHNISWAQVKAHAEPVYRDIRTIDPDNLVLVPPPNWAQDVTTVAQNPLQNVSNLAYTFHFYAQSHNFRAQADAALASGIALWASEWGVSDFTGDGAVDLSENGPSDQWVDWMRDRKISWTAWNFSNKPESSAALVPYVSDNSTNEAMWSNNALLNGVSMASGTWPNAVIKDSGKWIRQRIQEGTSTPCTKTIISSTTTLIQAENYCQMSGVQTENTNDTDGGQNVGYIDAGDWMTYSVNLPAAGTYKISYRIASQVGGGQIQLEKAGGSPVYSNINVPTTGDWQTWQTISHDVILPAGDQLLALSAISGGFNVNWLKIESASTTPAPTVIATIQAEDFSQQLGTQTENTFDTGGGKNVGWIDAGDWLSYAGTPVNIPSTGSYEIEYRVASQNGGGSLTFEEAGGSSSYGTLAIQSTGGWQTWTTIKHTVNLNAGSHKFGIKANNGGWNINWFKISKVN